jgi:hypothetical protein
VLGNKPVVLGIIVPELGRLGPRKHPDEFACAALDYTEFSVGGSIKAVSSVKQDARAPEIARRAGVFVEGTLAGRLGNTFVVK